MKIMYLTPSKIFYTHRDPEISNSTERAFYEMSKSVNSSTVFPKLQVVKKDGFYFTLNDAKLQVYRHLEKLGRCGSVEVEKISLKEVPEGIRQLMIAPDIVPRYKAHKTKDKQRKGKYQSISTSTGSEINIDESVVLSNCSEENDHDGVESIASENSDSDQSDFDSSDWSDEDLSGTDVDSSDDQNDDDDETRDNENESFI